MLKVFWLESDSPPSLKTSAAFTRFSSSNFFIFIPINSKIPYFPEEIPTFQPDATTMFCSRDDVFRVKSADGLH